MSDAHDNSEDMLLLRFTHIDPSDDNREFSIVIDISNPEYRGTSSCLSVASKDIDQLAVPTMSPTLPSLPFSTLR